MGYEYRLWRDSLSEATTRIISVESTAASSPGCFVVTLDVIIKGHGSVVKTWDTRTSEYCETAEEAIERAALAARDSMKQGFQLLPEE